MKKTDFSQKSPGKLTRLKRGFYAFSPNPLPPKISPSWELTERIEATAGQLGELRAIAQPAYRELILFREAALLSNYVGAEIDLFSLFRYALSNGSSPPQPVKPALRLKAAFDTIITWRDENIPLGIRFLEELHSVINGGGATADLRKRGTHPATLFHPGGERTDYHPSAVARIQIDMYALNKYLGKTGDLPPLVEAALILYQFYAISPFTRNNHEVAGLFLAAWLYVHDLTPYPSFSLSSFFRANADELHDAFLGVVTHGHFDRWLILIAAGIKKEGETQSGIVRSLTEIKNDYLSLIAGGRLSQVLPPFLDELFIFPAVTPTLAAATLRVTVRAAQLNIDKLCDLAILTEVTGRKRNRLFMAHDLVRLLST